MLNSRVLITIGTGLILFVIATVVFLGLTDIQIHKGSKITDFSSCMKAGNKVDDSSSPRVCVDKAGETFVESPSPSLSNQATDEPIDETPVTPGRGLIPKDVQPACVNKCGDNVCQQIVCQAVGCICAESPQSCPQDCK